MTLTLRRDQIEALVQLRSANPDLRIVMIGATALLHHLAIGRTTADIDLVLVAEVDAIGPLLEPLGWHRDQRQLQRWRNGDGVIADVLPGSANLIATGKVVFEQGFEMSLVGFDLHLATALTVTLPGTQFSLEVASLPALAVLKMVAWLDREHEQAL